MGTARIYEEGKLRATTLFAIEIIDGLAGPSLSLVLLVVDPIVFSLLLLLLLLTWAMLVSLFGNEVNEFIKLFMVFGLVDFVLSPNSFAESTWFPLLLLSLNAGGNRLFIPVVFYFFAIDTNSSTNDISSLAPLRL